MNKKKKTNTKKHTEWKKIEQKPRLSGENFREWAERIGIPSESVKDFKYWLIEKNKSMVG